VKVGDGLVPLLLRGHPFDTGVLGSTLWETPGFRPTSLAVQV